MPESYYTPKHQYEMMVIEGTRLLGLPDNEPGLYALILGSCKKAAKGFKRWVTHGVSPVNHKDVCSLDTPGFKYKMCSENVWFP